MRSSAIKGLYGIVDTTYVEPDKALKAARELISGGVKVLQLRAKELCTREMLMLARRIGEASREKGIPFVVNDRADIALLSHADGLHIGEEDISPEEARELLGPDKIIGFSTHTIAEAAEAEKLAGSGTVDYVSFGPVFPTFTKKDARDVVGLETLAQVRSMVSAPLVAIGGITYKNLGSVVQAGVDSVGVISALFAAEDLSAETFRFSRLFK